jgi:hypothetical protein
LEEHPEMIKNFYENINNMFESILSKFKDKKISELIPKNTLKNLAKYL